MKGLFFSQIKHFSLTLVIPNHVAIYLAGFLPSPYNWGEGSFILCAETVFPLLQMPVSLKTFWHVTVGKASAASASGTPPMTGQNICSRKKLSWPDSIFAISVCLLNSVWRFSRLSPVWSRDTQIVVFFFLQMFEISVSEWNLIQKCHSVMSFLSQFSCSYR